MSATEYTGPSVREMIANHSLAENIIKHHPAILDDNNLALLRQFVENPENRDSILKGERIEEGAGEGYRGSLAAYIVLKHGNGDVLTESEIEVLRNWFAERNG